jgi:long-chain acyl-CoA synthetase
MKERRHLASLVADCAALGDQTAIVTKHGLRRVATTYAELAELAGRFAGYLERSGIRKGDRVVIWGENGAAWVAAFFGCMLRGVVPVPVDAAGSAAFARRVVREVRPKLAVCGRDFVGELESATPVIVLDSLAETLTGLAMPDPIEDLGSDDMLQILFTSGTTAEPKGVVHTHGNVLASLGPIEREIAKYRKYERWFHPLGFGHALPLSHVFGQFLGMWIPVLLGAVVHFLPKIAAVQWIAEIKRERISVLAAVPRTLDLLAGALRSRFDGLDARVARMSGRPVWRRYWHFLDVHREMGFRFWAMICGGATLSAGLERFWSTMGFPVIQGYGMTETAALVSVNHPFRPAQGSIGEVLPGREVRLTDEGEILVRGETVARATWEQGEYKVRTDEWLATGDLARRDETGHLQFRGRKKDVIVTSAGMNIYPDDLEAVLHKQPAIRAATVVPVNGPAGPEPMAVLLLRGEGSAEDAIRDANGELAEYQKIRRWMVWPEPDFPRTSTGKVIRRMVAAGIQETNTKAGSLEEMIRQIGGPRGAGVEGLMLDSLGRVELEAAIEEKYGIPLEDVSKLLSEGAQDRESGQHVYPQWPWHPVAHAIRVVFLETVVRPLVWFLGAPAVDRGSETPAAPVLIVANHVSEVDVPLILYALPPAIRRRVAVAMTGEKLRDFRRGGPWSRTKYFLITALFNVFPLPRKANFRASFAHAGRAMDKGYHVLVFPEGRHTPDGQMHAFLRGSGILWKDLNCQALPVYLGGAGELKVQRKRWFRSGRVWLRTGSLIALPAAIDAAAAADLLEKSVRELTRPDLTGARTVR